MAKHGKKYNAAHAKLDLNAVHTLKEGIDLVKSLTYVGFDETVDISVNVGIDPAKGEQVVRGSVALPHGIGKTPKVAVFAKGDYADQAKAAGADYVGAEDLIDKIAEGWMDFDFTVATPDLMAAVGKLAKQLGPRGLLPNKKVGTVTFDVGPVVKELKQGKVFFKNDKSAVVHSILGKVSFSAQNLHENLTAFLKALAASKPATAKGKFLKKVTISSTMGVGIAINPDEVFKQ